MDIDINQFKVFNKTSDKPETGVIKRILTNPLFISGGGVLLVNKLVNINSNTIDNFNKFSRTASTSVFNTYIMNMPVGSVYSKYLIAISVPALGMYLYNLYKEVLKVNSTSERIIMILGGLLKIAVSVVGLLYVLYLCNDILNAISIIR